MPKKRTYDAGYGRLGTGPATSGPEAHLPVWWDRGYLPHVESPELVQHVTFHLADSLPREVALAMKAELDALPPMEREPARVARVNAYLDAGHGSCVLRDPAIGELVQNALLHFHGARYHLNAWCIMPNHVHVLFQTLAGWTMSRCVWSWKSFTGRLISQTLGSAGLRPENLPGGSRQNQVWHREYFDRYIRDQGHYTNAVDYIHDNPVKAGLVAKAADWRWSSANWGGLGPGEPSE